jgi:hypothetical protein
MVFSLFVQIIAASRLVGSAASWRPTNVDFAMNTILLLEKILPYYQRPVILVISGLVRCAATERARDIILCQVDMKPEH